MAIEKDWKQKYYDSLQQLDDRQGTWDELDKLLRKAISRLAITAKGINKRLDKILTSIQAHSRDKKDIALEQDLLDLSDLLAKLDDESIAKGKSVETAGASSNTHTASQSNTAAQPEADIHPYILKLIKTLHFETAKSGSSPLQSLDDLIKNLDRLDAEQSITRLADLINPFLDQSPQDDALIKEILIILVEKISFTHGSSEHLERLKEKLHSTFNITDWHEYLDEMVAEIRNIIQGINSEKIELESLIVDVTRQLSEISEVLVDEKSDSVAGHNDSLKLQAMMHQSVDNLQQKVIHESDINQLKSAINENLTTIKQGVEEFRKQDEVRFSKAEKRNTQLQLQIQQMEQESGQLQKKLSENRKKLMYDSLTQVRNRMSYDELLDQELSRYARYKEDFSFAILDIDHFKRVNDSFGHNAGDKALQIVAKMMSKYIRKTDFLFRIGGEEFVLLLPKTTLEHAQPLVEKIRSSIATASFHFKQQKVEMSMSAGLTVIKDTDNAETIFERADAALYEAKNSGRNRLIVSKD